MAKRRRQARTEEEREARAFEALRRARQEDLTRLEAARRVRVSEATVFKYTGRAWRRDAATGEYHPTESDNLVRPPMEFWSTTGLVEVRPRGLERAKRVADLAVAQINFLYTGDDSDLVQFRGFREGGYEAETDPDVLEATSAEIELPWLPLYRQS